MVEDRIVGRSVSRRRWAGIRLQILRERFGRFSCNLCANEIADQLTAVERATGEKIDNIVFMGMGEPLANLENGPWTIWIINAEWSPRYRPAPHYDLNQRVSAADSQTG